VVYLRAVPMAELATADNPARAAASALGGAAGAAVLSPLVAVCVLSSMQASVLVGPRIYQAMATDGVFFAAFGRLHRRTAVPVLALVAQGVIAIVQLLSGTFEQLVGFTMFAIVGFSTLTVGAVVVLRVRRPLAERPFRVPGYPWVPGLFVAVNVWMLWNVLTFGDKGPLQALVGLAIVAMGVPAYIAFRARARPQETGR
jgi:APA family basic amino acid/polyamine antiporter